MKLLFSRRKTVGSFVIRLVTWSVYSHVDIVVDDKFVIGALSFKGVVREPLQKRINESSSYLFMDITDKDTAKSFLYAINQIGKKYDWLGILGIAFQRNWENPKRWSCAELVVSALEADELNPFDRKYNHRITPQHLLMLNLKKYK